MITIQMFCLETSINFHIRLYNCKNLKRGVNTQINMYNKLLVSICDMAESNLRNQKPSLVRALAFPFLLQCKE